MIQPYLIRFYTPETGARIGMQQGEQVYDLTDAAGSIRDVLRNSVGRASELWDELLDTARSTANYPAVDFDNPPDSSVKHWLPPVDSQDVWASGVTYERSRAARQEEAVDGGDVYARVYAAERPELFFKARGERVVGPLDEVGIRVDSEWDVPEPELALVINPAMEVVGLTIGNDMSSRSIEGANPLYLPQAKVYNASCALGPGILPWSQMDWPKSTIKLTISRDGETAFEDSIHTDRIHRTMTDLVEHLGRSMTYPDGVVLLTGTGIVPPNDFTLQADDVVAITIDGIGTLTNTVKVV